MSDYVVSLIRTYVPIAVGCAVSWLAAHGLGLDASASSGAIVALTGLLTAAYYFAVRTLEQKFPFLGVLLGSAAKPSYTAAAEVGVMGKAGKPG